MKTTRIPKRTTRKKPGSRLLSLLAIVCACALVSIAGDKKKPVENYAIVAGTIFREPGFALPDATVAVFVRGDPKGKKLQQAVTNFRGEFAFRVPPVSATYVVKASLKGFHPQEKEVSVAGEERVDVTIVLAPESK